MTIDLVEIDKAGNHVLERNYSIAVVLNQEDVYGFCVPQHVQDALLSDFNKGLLNIKYRKRFKIRFHTSIIILIFKEVIKRRKKLNPKIEICNDIDGHLHEIKDMIFKNLIREIPNLKKENIVRQKFPKESLVDQAAKHFHKGAKNKLKEYNVYNLKLEDLKELIKKCGNQGQRP